MYTCGLTVVIKRMCYVMLLLRTLLLLQLIHNAESHHHVFSGKDDPEAQQDRVEEALSNVRVEHKERHLNNQREPVHWDYQTHRHRHTDILTDVYGPLSGTTQVSRYQKGETNLDFTEARDSEWQWH